MFSEKQIKSTRAIICHSNPELVLFHKQVSGTTVRYTMVHVFLSAVTHSLIELHDVKGVFSCNNLTNLS